MCLDVGAELFCYSVFVLESGRNLSGIHGSYVLCIPRLLRLVISSSMLECSGAGLWVAICACFLVTDGLRTGFINKNISHEPQKLRGSIEHQQ